MRKICNFLSSEGNQTMVEPGFALVDNPVNVTCDADIAGAPQETLGLDFLMLSWGDKNTDPFSIFMYQVSTNLGNDTVSYCN